MPPMSDSLSSASTLLSNPLATYCYTILGVSVAISSNLPATLEQIDERYGAFRIHTLAQADSLTLYLRCVGEDGIYLVSDSAGNVRPWSTAQLATRDLLDHLDHQIFIRIQEQGMDAIQGSALGYAAGGLMLAGPSGVGKTTLLLGLLARGLQLLSDEYIVLTSPAQLLPYQRSVQVRPGTIELIPQLHFLADTPPQRLSGSVEWSLTPDVLARLFSGCLSSAQPLRAVLLLDSVPRFTSNPSITPLSTALATVELLRGTWATGVDTTGRLSQISEQLQDAHCGRLHVGSLQATLACIIDWLAAHTD